MKTIRNTSIQSGSNSFVGLSDSEVLLLQKQFGKNVFEAANKHRLLVILKGIIKEPMFLLLTLACVLYFLLGQTWEGNAMLIAMLMVISISIYQELRSSRALKELNVLTEPKVKVRRNNTEQVIARQELVPGDIMLLDEGMKIPADGQVLQASDLSINEAVLTGESLPAFKTAESGMNEILQGTVIVSGYCTAKVLATGTHTQLGNIGKAIDQYSGRSSILQKQIRKFTKSLALFGGIAFVLVLLLNVKVSGWIPGLLSALTIAMSVLPEEIPVAFSSFMALGAYKLSRLGIIVRQPQVIETLGSVNCICLDKTGTITRNIMMVKQVYDYATDQWFEAGSDNFRAGKEVLYYSILASELQPFDAMEKAITFAWLSFQLPLPAFQMSGEYPLEGEPPMMTHVYELEGKRIAAAKGAPERILDACRITTSEKDQLLLKIHEYASKGFRLLGIAKASQDIENKLPSEQNNFPWEFMGFIALYDPPKENIPVVLEQLKAAGIEVKILTGDYPATAANIAAQIGLADNINCITGNEVMQMDMDQLCRIVTRYNVFARMFPDAKMRVIAALQSNQMVIAMTGDGVNDGLALKTSDIGISMGKGGTAIAQEAADLVLTNDDLEGLVIAVKNGRKISDNFKKAIRYIISIHIPIILTASLPLILGWPYANIFTPLHVIFLELIMGPTCSLFYEREPADQYIMQRSPIAAGKHLFNTPELMISIIQGLAIAASVLGIFYYFMLKGASLPETRTAVFTVLVMANFFLSFVNRSFTKTSLQTIFIKNDFIWFIILTTIFLLVSINFIPAVRNIFGLEKIGSRHFLLCLVSAAASVLWLDIYKMIRGRLQHLTLTPGIDIYQR